MKTYRIAGCRDYARIDLRLPKGAKEPIVKRVAWDNVLAKRGSFMRAAEVAGYTTAELMHRIVSEALFRYGLAADVRVDSGATENNDTNIDADKSMVAK